MSPAYGRAPDRKAARRRLRIANSSRALLLLGRLRPLQGRRPVRIRIRRSGRPRSCRYLRRHPRRPLHRRSSSDAPARDSRIRLLIGRASDDSVLDLIAAADVVCVPTEPFRNFGSAMLALSYCRPILASQSPALDELRRLVGDGWITSYEPPLGRRGSASSAGRSCGE